MINKFPDLEFDKNQNYIYGELHFCAIYFGNKKITFGTPVLLQKKHGLIFEKERVDGCFNIKIDLSKVENNLPKVYELDQEIERIEQENNVKHINSDQSCCLGIFEKVIYKDYSDLIEKYILPYFVWHAFIDRYKKVPPCDQYSHGDKGKKEYETDKERTPKNALCLCGSGKKSKYCCNKKKKQ